MISCPVKPFVHPISEAASVFYLAPAPAAGLRTCVVLPACNEEEHLQDALSALYYQVDGKGRLLFKSTYEVLLLINNSNDASLEIALRFQQQHPDFALHIAYISLPKPKANIGTVRKMLMDEAFFRLRECANGIIASTDSDTVVDSQWIHCILSEMDKGVDAVGGRILTRGKANCSVRLWHLRDVMYRTLLTKAEGIIDPCQYDPWPRHYQYFGANMAVTCLAYEKAGRIPEVPFLEDHAFCEALKMVDARIRRSNAAKVYTSDRQEGRVAVGFSEQLQHWSKSVATNKIQVTEPVAPQIIKWRCKRALRKLHLRFHTQEKFRTADLAAICRLLQLPYNWVMNRVEACTCFGELWQAVEKRLIVNKWNEQWLPQPITEAITELRLFISGNR